MAKEFLRRFVFGLPPKTHTALKNAAKRRNITTQRLLELITAPDVEELLQEEERVHELADNGEDVGNPQPADSQPTELRLSFLRHERPGVVASAAPLKTKSHAPSCSIVGIDRAT